MDGFEGRFDSLERRFDAVERRIDGLDAKVECVREELSGRISSLDAKVSTHFRWLVGGQVAVLLAVIAALAGR